MLPKSGPSEGFAMTANQGASDLNHDLNFRTEIFI